MRAKDVLAYIPFVTVFCTNLKLIWFRITATRLTTIYFIFSIVNCLVQALLQGEATVVNAKAANYLFDVVKAGNATADGFYVWSHQELRYCDHVPNSVDATRCTLVWKPEPVSSNSANGALGISYYSSSTIAATATAFRNPSSSLPTSASLKPTVVASTTSASALPTATSKPTVIVVAPDNDADDSNEVLVFSSSPAERRSVVGVLEINVNGSVDVVLDGWGFDNTPATLSQRCVDALNWPVQELENTKREDIAFTAFQFWVLSMSLVALLNESIPHIIVSLVTHLSSVAWGAFQLSQTQVFHRKFNSLITDGVCQVNLLPTYWKARSNVEIPSLALNAAALFMSIFLSYRLIKMFGWQTFKRVGASRTIKRVYQLVLVLSVTIQLCLFFVVASVALWLDQICNGAIGRMATGHKLYEALLAVVLALLPFWLIGGWLAVRRELKTTMTIFLFLSFAYIVGWGAMFDSTTFRWTMSQWSFFAVVMVTAVSLVIVCFVVGIICRINFNRGLPHYLNAEEPLPGDDFERVTTEKAYGNSDPEKFEFPSAHGPVPTYEAAFGYDDDVPPPPGTRTLGPRFYAQDNAPLTVDTDQLAGPVDLSNVNLPSQASRHSQSFTSTRAPSPVYSRDGSDTTAHSGLPSSVRPLMRHGSSNSQSSFTSAKSAASSASQTMRPRWVIE